MTDTPPELRNEFRRLVQQAVREGLTALQKAVEAQCYISSYGEWPTFWLEKNGLPHLHQGTIGGPPDYSSGFGKRETAAINTENLPTFGAVLSFARDNLSIGSLICTAHHDPALAVMLLEVSTQIFLGGLIERHVHAFHSYTVTDKTFAQIFDPIDCYLFGENLKLQIVVPALFVTFDFEDAEIAPGIRIRRMDEDFHLARAFRIAHGPGVHPSVVASATHALVMHGYALENLPPRHLDMFPDDPFNDTSKFPTVQIDDFFAALRIVTGLATGYAQLLVRPEGWARGYKAHLPVVEGTSVRAYPVWFENYYWNISKVPEISLATALEIGRALVNLSNASEPSIRLAARRLNISFLRHEIEDQVLDATIGLEASFLRWRVAGIGTQACNEAGGYIAGVKYLFAIAHGGV